MSLRNRLFSLSAAVLGAALALCATPARAAAPVPASLYQGMQWRLVGPFRGGWATMATGVPGSPDTYYFGAADGGVWKTDNAGRTWHPLMQHQRSATVGALAVAPSNPKILYVGTGQVAARYDIPAGDGVYRSADGGKTWTNVGLRGTRHIGRILVDPKNPNRVLVAALGHVFGPNAQRGVYLSTDGGQHWKKTLFVNKNTGAVDLASDPEHPSVVYAATWQMRMHPWLDYFMPQAGPGSGIWKSTDGGETWHKLTGHGLPSGTEGRIGLAVARGTGGQTVYATIAVANGKPGTDNMSTGGGSGIYRSTDGGRHWKLVNDGPGLASSYFGRLTVSPKDPDTVYVMGRGIRKSTDGGRHFRIFKGAPGGDDYHFLWINPERPDHMITAADQGCVVTVNGGKSWSSWYNQPTAQFYHIAADNRFPYWIYGGQQDTGTVGIASRGPDGVIGPRQWHPVGGDERDFDVPKPGDANLVFGSGLGGYLSRYNQTTHQVTDVSPWPVSTYGADPRQVKNRYTWITPIAFARQAPHPLYFGSQKLFRSIDDGAHWQTVSPDLSGAQPHPKDCAHAGHSRTAAKRCGFGVIFAITPSPDKRGTVWVGTDDGEVQLTTDGGKHWRNVTPKGMPLWGRIDAISVSRKDANLVYVAVDTHRLGELHPVLFRTTDGGSHWNKVVAGLPGDEYVTSVAADTHRKDLVFAATNRSVYVSFDAGGHWQPLGLNLPTTSVRDLLVHGDDLVAGTMGRGIWSLDDIAPLRQATAHIADSTAHLFDPAVAIRLRNSQNRDTPPPHSEPRADNPPTGAVIDYWLAKDMKGPVTLTVRNADGKVVRRFSSAAGGNNIPTGVRYFESEWLGHRQQLQSGAGLHRFVWNLRWPRPPAIEYNFSISAVWKQDTPLIPQGAMALPGKYTVTLSAGGKHYTAPLTVKMDPRVDVPHKALAAKLAFEQQISSSLARGVKAYEQSGKYLDRLKNRGGESAAVSAVRKLRDGGKDSLHSVTGTLDTLAARVEQSDAAPTQGQRAVFSAYGDKLQALLSNWHKLRGNG